MSEVKELEGLSRYRLAALEVLKASKGKPKRVLLVDDSNAVQEIIGYFLERNEVEVSHAHNLAEAAHFVETGHYFNLVIVDLRLEQHEDGIEVIKKVRTRNPAWAVFVYSGFIDEDVIYRINRECGAVVYASKHELSDLYLTTLFGMFNLLKINPDPDTP